ncbi:MAG: PEGA domain-containing protein [Candidatus Saccharibacteria bacterium]|nr:PEGA domain-containing protein [Candidatus Saccharibacteria bacterium]
MDKERQRRMQNVRLIITEAVMTVVVVAMVIILTFIAMGYKFDQDGELSQNGLVQISTFPSGATVVLDGESLFARTDTSRSLSAGNHTVELSRAGYDSWQKTIEIRSGWLYKLDYPRLFKLERETSEVQRFDNGLEFLSMSPDRNSILYADENSLIWHWLRVRGDDVQRTDISVAEFFGLAASITEFPGEIRDICWSDSSDRVLIDWTNGDMRNFIVVNLARPENSLNLTTAFGMNFSKVLPVSSSADRLMALENGNLRTISTGNKEMSQILLSNIADFANNESETLFITTPNEEGVSTIGYYTEGNKTPINLQTVAGAGVKMAISKYLDMRYLTIAIGPEVTIYSTEELKSDTTLEDLRLVKRVNSSVAPDKIEIHNRGRLVMVSNDRHVLMFDAEQGQTSEFDLETVPTGWLDGFILTNVVEHKLVVRDFDGENRRELANTKDGYQAMVSSNNNYLYYIVECGTEVESRSCLQRDRL